MSYEDISAELERGIDWASLESRPAAGVLRDRLVAMRQLAALHEREAQRLQHESEQLDNLLMAI
jgi:hypothetical protein